MYILKSLKNNRFYIGSTNNLERRIEQHISGLSKYTKQILPVVLVFQQKYPLLNQARKIEHWLKKQKSSSLINQIVLEGIINKKI